MDFLVVVCELLFWLLFQKTRSPRLRLPSAKAGQWNRLKSQTSFSAIGSFASLRRFKVNSFSRIVWRGVKRQQQRALAFGRHVVTVPHALWNDDQIANGGDARVRAGDHHDAPFEHIKLVI